MSRKGSGRTPEQQRVWMREYMRARRAGTLVRVNATATPGPKRSEAAYDPARDGPLAHDSLTAVLMGDPPIGRRALDR